MQIKELRELITETLTKTKVLKLTEIAKRRDFKVQDLIDLTFDADQQIGFRAAWILENLLLTEPLLLLANLDELILRFPQVSNPSCRRHYVKIITQLTSPKVTSEIKVKMQKIDLEPVVETCFDWIINPKVLIAVKVFCCEVLFNLRNRFEWIADQLVPQIEFLMKDGSVAIQSKGKKLLRNLEK